MNICKKKRMSKYSAFLEIKAFLCMADDVTFVENFFLYENLQIYGKKTPRNSKIGSEF